MLEFFSTINFFKKKKDLGSFTSFGLFLDLSLNLRRKKIKNDFFEDFREINLISLLEHTDTEAYYQNNYTCFELLGIEFRFNEAEKDSLLDDSVVVNILREIRETKKKLTLNERKPL